MKRFLSLKTRYILSCLMLGALSAGNFALFADSPLKFNTKIHDFGPVLMSDGPLKCEFTACNVSSKDVVIQSVTTSCGCTTAGWPHEAIAPGQKIKITARYTNDEGPHPFDKTLTVKLSEGGAPILLHIRGISQDKPRSDAELFPELFGGVLGLVSSTLKTKNIEMGNAASDQIMAANLSSAPLKVSFTDVTEGLSVSVKPNPIPPHAHADIYYTVSSLPGKWGKNLYGATMVLNGSSTGKRITVQALTAMNFSSMTREQKASGSRPMFRESTFSFGHKKQGACLTASFTCENTGKAALHVYKADSDFDGARCGALQDVAPGASSELRVSLDTAGLPKGETLIIITLTTNSPLRPVVNLFIAGWLD